MKSAGASPQWLKLVAMAIAGAALALFVRYAGADVKDGDTSEYTIELPA